MPARIYRPAKTAMQSGQARTKEWVIEHEKTAAKTIDPLMGWAGSSDTQAQINLSFDTLDEAVAYAKERKTFGVPIGQHQLVAAMLAEMAIKIEATRGDERIETSSLTRKGQHTSRF